MYIHMSKLINRVTRNYKYTGQAFEPETPASHQPLPVHPSYLPAIDHRYPASPGLTSYLQARALCASGCMTERARARRISG